MGADGFAKQVSRGDLKDFEANGIPPELMKEMEDSSTSITLTGGLTADTPLFIGDQLAAIRSLFIMSAHTPHPTYAINLETKIPCESEIISLPREIYLNDLWEIGLSNGFHMTCTPATQILTPVGYIPVANIDVGAPIVGLFFDTDTSQIKEELINLTISEKRYKIIQEPIYYFFAKHENILVPHFNPEIGKLSFVSIHQ